MNVLVTGGAGYIGSTVATLLVEAGHRVTVVDDLSSGRASAVPDGATFVKARFQEAADEVLVAAAFDAVLHFAGFIEVGESVDTPGKYWDNNVCGTLRLLDAMLRHGVSRVIFSSTGTVYGDAAQQPITEATGLAPQNPYAATKAAVDLMLAGYCTAYGLAATSLRYFNASGALLRSGTGSCGEQHDPESHLIPIVLQVAAGERAAVPLYGDDYDTVDGTCVRDYVHVADLADAHLLALEAGIPGRHRVFNLGNGSGFTNLQVIEAVRAVTGAAVPVVHERRRPGDVVTLVASSTRARSELGWRPSRGLTDNISDAWTFQHSTRCGR